MIRFILSIVMIITSATMTLAQEEAERSNLIRFVEEKLSTPDRIIRLNGLSGALSSDVALTSITIADSEGVWLTINEPRLVWERSALLRGRLNIERLAADTINVIRKPISAPTAPNMEANEFAIPELPVALRIDALEINTVALSEPVLGFATSFSINGNTALNDEGFAALLNIVRLDDVKGSLELDVSYDRDTEQFAVDTRLSEPGNGIIANALQIPNEPAVDFTIQGEGLIDALTVNVALKADQTDIVSGIIETSPADGGTALRFDLGGPLARIVPPQVADFLGANNTLQGQALIADDGRLVVDNLTLDGGVLSVNGALARAADGLFTTAQLAITLTPDTGETVINLPSEDSASIASAAIDLTFDSAASPSLNLSIDADTYTSSAAQIDSVNFDLTGMLIDQSTGLDFDGIGRISGFAVDDEKLSAALGSVFDLALSGAWRSDKPLIIETLSIAARDFATTLAAQIDGTNVDAQGSISVNALSQLAALGNVDVKGTTKIDLAGQFDALTRAFDVAVNGVANTAFAPGTPMDALLSGPTLINGGVSRTAQGTQFDRVTIDAPNIIVTADGLLSPDGTDLTLLSKLTDLSLLTANASGAATANVRLSGAAPRYALDARVQLPSGKLANLNTNNLSVLFNGFIEGQNLDGILGATGTLDDNALILNGQIEAADGALKLDDFVLGLGPNQIAGNVARNSTNGLLMGRFNIDAPNIQPLAALALQKADGRLTGSIELAPVAGQQRIALQTNASGISYNNITLDDAAIDMRVDNALASPSFAGTINAQTIQAADITLAALQTTLNGTSERTNFTVTVSDVRSGAVAQIAPATITASGSFDSAPGLLNLQQFSVTNSQDINVSGGGTLITSSGALNMRISGQAPLNIAEPFLASRGTSIDGLARFDASIGGTTGNPLINGLLSLADGTVSDPLANISLTNINVLAGLNGDQVSINRMNARIGNTGNLTIGGTVNIAASMPANLQINLTNVPYSDGQTFATTLSGSLAVTGPLAGQPTLSGSIDLARTEVTVPESFGAASNLLDVDHIRPDGKTSTTLQRVQQTAPKQDTSGGGGIILDLTINAPSQIFVRGRGLDAELGGSLTVRGNSANVSPLGQFNLRRGRLEILGQRLDFDQGSIRLVGDLDPFLRFRVATIIGDTTAFITLSGRANELQFAFTSSPELPQDEVVALLLFGRPVSELSPVQILRLASAISELTGEDALDLVGFSRDLLGIDDLDIVDDGQGNAAVRAGAYINDRVYLGVEAGSETEASINLDITNNLKARGSVATDGESKLGIFFERDY